jgi:hypothetical protein
MMVQGREIIKANPKTDEELKAVKAKHPVPLPAGRIVVEPDEEEEAPATGKEPKEDLLPRQRALVDQFNHACEELLTLASKASTVFLHSDVTAHDLDLLGNFLKQVAASKRKGAR